MGPTKSGRAAPSRLTSIAAGRKIMVGFGLVRNMSGRKESDYLRY